jgi:hypothetical protein
MTLLGAPEESGKSQINLDDLVPRKISLRELDGAQCHPVARQPSAGVSEPRGTKDEHLMSKHAAPG